MIFLVSYFRMGKSTIGIRALSEGQSSDPYDSQLPPSLSLSLSLQTKGAEAESGTAKGPNNGEFDLFICLGTLPKAAGRQADLPSSIFFTPI